MELVDPCMGILMPQVHSVVRSAQAESVSLGLQHHVAFHLIPELLKIPDWAALDRESV